MRINIPILPEFCYTEYKKNMDARHPNNEKDVSPMGTSDMENESLDTHRAEDLAMK